MDMIKQIEELWRDERKKTISAIWEAYKKAASAQHENLHDGGRGRMKQLKRFWAWILSGDALTVQEMQKKLVLFSELV